LTGFQKGGFDMNIREDMRSFIIDNFLFGDDALLKDDSSLVKDGIVDSTGIMELVTFIQDKYLIRVEDEEITPENLDSIAKACLFVEQKQQLAKSA
jgi:acyl carrier protein